MTSFAAYASQFLTRPNESSLSTSSNQPMFFSFTTDASEYDREEAGDEDDPHLMQSSSRMLASELLRASDRMDSDDDDDDDEDEVPPPPRISNQSIRVNQSMTESLLPGFKFSLPDPRRRVKYNDAGWTALYLACITFCTVLLIVLLFTTSSASSEGRGSYRTLLKTIPFLVILTFTSAVLSFLHVWLLSIFVSPVMLLTSLAVPVGMFVCTVWTFVASFLWVQEDGLEPSWAETTGLRLFSLIPLTLTILSSRRLLTGSLLNEIRSTSRILSLVSRILLSHPHLLVLSPIVLLFTFLLSIPFITIIFRLVLVGYTVGGGSTRLEYHLRSYSTWGILFTTAVWLWTFGIARGILRVVCAGVVGAWYFTEFDHAPTTTTLETETNPTPAQTEAAAAGGIVFSLSTNIYPTEPLHRSIHRALHPSLGSIALSTLLTTLLTLLTTISLFLTFLISNLPIWFPLYLTRSSLLLRILTLILGWLTSLTESTSRFSLTYIGITGVPYSQARKESPKSTVPSLSVLERMLAMARFTLVLPISVGTFLLLSRLVSAGGNPPKGMEGEPLYAAILAGVVASVVHSVCTSLVRDTAETVWVCSVLPPPSSSSSSSGDEEESEKRRTEIRDIFEGRVGFSIGVEGERRIKNRGKKGLYSHAPPPPPSAPVPSSSRRPPPPLVDEYPEESIPFEFDVGPESIRPLPPPPPPATAPASLSQHPPHEEEDEDEDDVNPFSHSYLSDVDASASALPMPIPDSSDEGEGDSDGDVGSPFGFTGSAIGGHHHHSRGASASASGSGSAGIPSHSRVGSGSNSRLVGSGHRSGSGSRRKEEQKEQEEDEVDEDDLFPGSGFF